MNKNGIEDILKDLGGETVPVDVQRRAEEASKTFSKTSMSSRQHILWGNVMKSRMTKLAAAAVIVIAVLFGIYYFGGSIDMASIALADVETAFLAQSWVHLQYENGEESWYNLENGDHCHVRSYMWGNSFSYVNRTDNRQQRYTPQFGQHITENRLGTYEDNNIPQYEPKTAWESIVGHLEETLENGGSTRRWEVEKYSDQVDGVQLVRFDRYYNDAIDRRLLIEQIWANPQTRLPVRIWKRLSLADRKAQNRESVSGEFYFPETGPSSIYELGVPEDLPIVRIYDRVADSSIVEVVEAAKSHLENFPQQYRSIRWDNSMASEIDVVWRYGEKRRHNRYFNVGHDLNLPASAEDIIDWSATQIPVSVEVWDGTKSYNLSGRRTVRILKWDSLSTSSRPHNNFWPHADRNPESFQLIDDAPEELAGYMGLRIDLGDIRRDFYIDPEHDYIYVKWIWWKQRAGSWEKEREYEHSDFIRLPQGQWYAARRILITYPDPEKGTSRGGANWNIDIKELQEDEYPPDTFEGEKLMEGVKVETY